MQIQRALEWFTTLSVVETFFIKTSADEEDIKSRQPVTQLNVHDQIVHSLQGITIERGEAGAAERITPLAETVEEYADDELLPKPPLPPHPVSPPPPTRLNPRFKRVGDSGANDSALAWFITPPEGGGEEAAGAAVMYEPPRSTGPFFVRIIGRDADNELPSKPHPSSVTQPNVHGQIVNILPPLPPTLPPPHPPPTLPPPPPLSLNPRFRRVGDSAATL